MNIPLELGLAALNFACIVVALTAARHAARQGRYRLRKALSWLAVVLLRPLGLYLAASALSPMAELLYPAMVVDVLWPLTFMEIGTCMIVLTAAVLAERAWLPSPTTCTGAAPRNRPRRPRDCHPGDRLSAAAPTSPGPATG